MKHSLQPLWVSRLTNLEGGQLMKRHLNDLGTIDPALMTDLPFNAYVKDLTGYADLYEKALAQVRKNEETQKIELADDVRDKALEAFGRALNLYAASDDAAETEASRVLRILFDNYGELTRLNYEAETMGIDKLLGELGSKKYSAKVGLLQMERYVTRISNANAAFKALFSGRITTTALTETYDLKGIRLELFRRYSEFCDYVSAMANALNTPLFVKALNLLNTARKYYADMLAKRTATKAEAAQPAE